MNTYSIGSDSPRWWWPSAAAGVAGAAAIAAILVLPAPVTTTVLDVPAELVPVPSGNGHHPTKPVRDPVG